MKRFHLHLHVGDLDKTVSFYSSVFGREPDVLKPDYAKWLMEEPALNFAVTQTVAKDAACCSSVEPGSVISHVGFQFDSDAELSAFRDRLEASDIAHFDQEKANCCYARSDKAWIEDPDGVRWEAFRTHEGSEEYGEDTLARISHKAGVDRKKPAESRCCSTAR